jgi:hypothetical protein
VSIESSELKRRGCLAELSVFSGSKRAAGADFFGVYRGGESYEGSVERFVCPSKLQQITSEAAVMAENLLNPRQKRPTAGINLTRFAKSVNADFLCS